MTLAAYTGFRVGARNDDYRVPHLTLILYDLIILFSSNRTADEPHLAVHPQFRCMANIGAMANSLPEPKHPVDAMPFSGGLDWHINTICQNCW